MNPFSPEEMRRIAELGEIVRSATKRAKKAERAQAMAQITEEDHQLLVDWMSYRLSGERLKNLTKPDIGITKPTGFVWRKGQKPERRG